MSARLAILALATFVVADSFVMLGTDAFAQTVINNNPRAPATYNGQAYYTPQPYGTTTVTDKTGTQNGVTIDERTISNTQESGPVFTPNRYNADGFTPNPPGYANAGQQSAVTTNSTAANRGGGYNPMAQFASPAAVPASPYGAQSAATYNAAAAVGAQSAGPALNNAAAAAGELNTSHSTANYNNE